MARYALSFDIGGTFTDFVLFEIGSKQVRAFHKVLTTAREPALGVLQGWRELIAAHNLAVSDVVLAVHSTTLVTNTIIERQGAVAGLLTTQGYRDTLEIGAEQIYDIYDLFAPYPAPLIEREHRIEIAERLAFDGRVIEPLDPDKVTAAVRHLVDDGVEAVAISFLHSYADPRHEQQAEQAIKEVFPDLDVSISSRVAPLIGEYERTSTVATDAYVKPKVRRYLDDLVAQLRALGFKHDLNVMLSAGGVTTASVATQYPIRLLESGPAAGGLVGAFYGKLAGLTELIALDMGGTTAKLCLIENGEPEVTQLFEVDRMHRFKPGSGLPVAVPAIDLVEIGAGGGSIAWIDNLGLLKVGPQSAASEPGPACYGRGGSEPTVTDANLILGYLDPGYFLGGRLALDRAAATHAVRHVAEPLGIDLATAAWGIHSIVNGNMAAVARLHILERNRDPRDFTLFVSGGAGPAHAAAVARLIGVRNLIFPMGIGVASAVGALVAPLSFSFTRTYLTDLDAAASEHIERLYGQMEEEARRTLAAAGVDQDTVTVRRSVDLRYTGQYHTLEVSLPEESLAPDWQRRLRETFLERYRQRYGRAIEGQAIEAVNWKTTAEGGEARVALAPEAASADANAALALKARRHAYFPRPAPGYVDCPVYDRYRLGPGTVLVGPAIIEEREATIVLWPGDEARVDGYHNLLVSLSEEA
jgi:N-methylhydantoinase A/oxoprolinase/acetone carboxylase beta subunit